MILVAVVILVGVFFVATGRGGELAYEQADHAPLDLGPVSATDVALLRPPTALWGYNMQVTDEALEQIAQAVRDRDVTIAFLQQRLADLAGQAAPGRLADLAGQAGPGFQPAAPGFQPAEPPRVHGAPHARPAESADPASREPPARPPGPGEGADAPPGGGALAAEEQTW
jgi:hypothetical protein